MPRYARPATSEDVEDPIKALGTMLRAGIIGYLRQHGPATRGEIAAAMNIPPITVGQTLNALLDAGLLSADPPRETAKSGQRIRYAVNGPAVTEMYLQLGQAIGEV